MNILPKKRWHVRTKENVARVRKDQAKAKEEELELLRRKHLAEKEARINELRGRTGNRNSTPQPSTSSQSLSSDLPKTEHVNLFADYEMGLTQSNAVNKEYVKEQLEITQRYEKQIGLLTFLGQDTNEELKLKSWYELPRQDLHKVNKEKDEIVKEKYDPLSIIKLHCGIKEKIQENVTESSSILVKKLKKLKKKSKKKKHKHREKKSKHQEDKKDTFHKLREQRLKREAMEKSRQKEIILKAKGILPLPPKQPEETASTEKIKQKYNSQFNPEIAKQNMFN